MNNLSVKVKKIYKKQTKIYFLNNLLIFMVSILLIRVNYIFNIDEYFSMILFMKILLLY